MKVESKGNELIITRIFNAPPALMFEMWSHCKHLKHWWGPKEWPMDECSLDFHVGGEWRYCLRGPNEGDESWGIAVYKEIEKPEKIVYQDNFSDKFGNINKQMPTMVVTNKFIENNGKTTQVSNIIYESPEEFKKVLDMGMIKGMTSSMERLDEYLATI
jgi:uncharacterized protein YndB with AHSA1/START domain